MNRRAISFLMTLILAVSILSMTVLAQENMSNFTKSKTYPPGLFTDVTDEWFAQDVRAAYEYGLINGKSDTTFEPSSNLTIAEAIKLAACMSSIYIAGSVNLTNAADGLPWYRPYVDYALTNGIISSEYKNYNANATRADFAQIFVKALPDEALPAINNIEDNAIPDVSVGYTYGSAVYKLYRAGVLVGSNDTGAFFPNTGITRDAVATIAARMADPTRRVPLTLKAKELSATQISAKYSSAVFCLELYSEAGTVIGLGSGFFINSTGLAVTNYHVIKDITTAKAKTKGGDTYDISGIYDFNESSDLALIQVNGSNFDYINVGDSDSAAKGDAIYAIGYPLGIDHTVTSGTITGTSRIIDGVTYLMMDASISSGSSGGPLIDSFGNAIGVTSAAHVDSGLNLAVPINSLKKLSDQSFEPLSTAFARTVTYYPKYTTVPDFGARADLEAIDSSTSYHEGFQVRDYTYRVFSAPEDVEDILDDYVYALWLEGFTIEGYQLIDGYYFKYYTDAYNTWSVRIGMYMINGNSFVFISLMPSQMLE